MKKNLLKTLIIFLFVLTVVGGGIITTNGTDEPPLMGENATVCIRNI